MPTILISNFWYLLWGAEVTVALAAAGIVLSALIGLAVALLQAATP